MAGPPSAEERLERIAEAHRLLASVSHRLGPSLELETTLKAVLEAMRALVDFRGGSISLVERGFVRIAAADPPVSEEVLALRLPVGAGIGGRVVASGETIYVPDLDSDDRVDPEVRRTGSNAGMTSFLAVPLVCLGTTVGLLQVDSPTRDAFDDVDIMLLEGLAAQTATAIESARQSRERDQVDALKHGFINLVSHELAGSAEVVAAEGVLEVRDEGPGLPDDVLDRHGETFSRSVRNPTTVAGLGLGLSMVTAMVGELEGELSVDTAPGAGTTVRIRLPA